MARRHDPVASCPSARVGATIRTTVTGPESRAKQAGNKKKAEKNQSLFNAIGHPIPKYHRA
jgi:hypothetical protein